MHVQTHAAQVHACMHGACHPLAHSLTRHLVAVRDVVGCTVLCVAVSRRRSAA